MSQEIVIDNEFATLWYYPQTRIVHSKLKKLPSIDGMKELLNKACETMKSRGASKFLTDARNSGTLPMEFDEWRKNDWLPRMVKAGWKFWAPLLPASAIAQMHINRFTKDFVSVGVNVQPFSDPAEAMTWLEKQ